MQAGQAATSAPKAKVDVGVGTRGHDIELGIVDANALRRKHFK